MEVAMRLALALCCGFLAGIADASATPQMIALVPTDEPVPFACQEGTCTVELATYCLEEYRAAPKAGHVYTLHGGVAGLALVTAEGARVPLAAEPAIAAARTYVAVSLALPESALPDRVAGLVIGDGVVLVPEVVAGDPDAQTPEDIAEAVTIAKTVGYMVVAVSPEIGVALELGRAVNAIQAGADSATLGSEISLESGAIYAACLGLEAMGGADLLTCLKGRRDSLLSGTNVRFWRALATGS
jgi:hypothetical protein